MGKQKIKAFGGSKYIMLTKYGVKVDDQYDVYRNEKDEIILKPSKELNDA